MEIEILPGTTTNLWTYNGVFPGPMIRATVGDTLIVHFENQLSESSTIHWHGMRVPNNMDGAPLVQDPVKPGESFTYEYVIRDAGTYWYHPHVRTNEQVERGLYGPLIVHEQQPPAYDAERVLVLDDIRLEDDGSRSPFLDINPDNMHGRNGNLLLVNGKAGDSTEEITIRPGTVERWRILNTANARFAELEFPGLEWRVIALDGGFVKKSFTPDSLMVAPGERYDVEVRLADGVGTVKGALDYIVPMFDGEEVVFTPITLFQVASDGQSPLERREIPLPEVHMPNWPASTDHIVVELDGGHVGMGIKWFLNGDVWGDHTPVQVELDKVYTIDFVNKSFVDHPMHIHGHFFKVVSPEGAYPGLKDTVIVPGESTVRIKILFDNPGKWMYHCHILEHAKVGMMSVIEVK
jgi:FtsP/CotA-like multicopper oxidase with cupredoxin domain